MIQKRSKDEQERICALVAAKKESPQPGLLEQWLREGKISKERAMIEAYNLLPAGVDTVSI